MLLGNDFARLRRELMSLSPWLLSNDRMQVAPYDSR